MFSRRNNETGILSNFVIIKNSWYSVKSKTKAKKLKSFPDQRNQTNFLDAGFKGTEKYVSFKSSLHL